MSTDIMEKFIDFLEGADETADPEFRKAVEEYRKSGENEAQEYELRICARGAVSTRHEDGNPEGDAVWRGSFRQRRIISSPSERSEMSDFLGLIQANLGSVESGWEEEQQEVRGSCNIRKSPEPEKVLDIEENEEDCAIDMVA